MAQTLTSLLKMILNTPGTNEQVQISELNSNFSKIDNRFTPGCMMAFTGSQSPATATYTDSDYNQIRYDSFAARSEGPMADIGTNQITIRKDGPYLLKAASGFTTNGTGQRRISIMVNGVEQVNWERAADAGGPVMLECSIVLLMTAGDVVKSQIRQTSGGALGVTANTALNGCHLSANWFGSAVEV